jgi:hypothetical protein
VEGKKETIFFLAHLSYVYIRDTPASVKKGDVCSYYTSPIMQVKEMCVSRGTSTFITKVGASPIPSLITKARTSHFIMKADASPIPYIEDER